MKNNIKLLKSSFSELITKYLKINTAHKIYKHSQVPCDQYKQVMT